MFDKHTYMPFGCFIMFNTLISYSVSQNIYLNYN